MQILIVVFLLFSVAIAVFAIQNPLIVNIKYFTWSFDNISLVAIILGSFLLGVLLTLLLSVYKNIINKMRMNELLNKVQNLSEEKSRLENEIKNISQKSSSFTDTQKIEK